MAGKRPQDDSHSEVTNSLFEKLFAIANASELADSATLNILKELKRRLLSAEAEDKESIHKAANEFGLAEAVLDFGLTYSPSLRDVAKHRWKIEGLPDIKTFEPSACLVSFLENCTGIYDRSSEAGRRVAVDFILFECIAVMRGVSGISPAQSTEDGRRTPTPWDNVKVYCQVSFIHTMPTTPKTIVGGRIDHSVGIVIRSEKVPNRLFHSLLLCVEAKFHVSFDAALVQLVVYLACLRQSRVNRGQTNTSVYGVATDGLSYVFMTITHEGVLKQSRLFSVMGEGLPAVLGCLQYILETAMSIPNVMPERGALKKSEELEVDGDDPIDLDDSPYLHHV